MESETEKYYQPDDFLTPEDMRKFSSYFKREALLLPRIFEYVPQIIGSLRKTGADADFCRHFLLSLADTEHRVPTTRIADFPITAAMVRELEDAGHFDLVTADLLTDTIRTDTEGLVKYPFFYNKFLRIIGEYARTDTDETIPYLSGNRLTVTAFPEPDSRRFCKEIIGSVRPGLDCLGISNYSSLIGSKEPSGNGPVITAEVFKDRSGSRLVRVGYLFFIDAGLKETIPPGILEMLGGNCIFLDQLPESEFGSRLGYYTCNTLVSMMQTDFRGRNVLDCGSGSSVLSLVAKRMGAHITAGIEMDDACIRRAEVNVKLNSYTGGDMRIIHEDLRNRQPVIRKLGKNFMANPVIILSNIGHWSEYPISSITTISYVDAFRSSRGAVEAVICGGHDRVIATKIKPGEDVLLREIGLNGKLPRNPSDCDRLLLESMGYSERCRSESETLVSTGSSRQAGSFVAVNTMPVSGS